jgi:hypothetical protein
VKPILDAHRIILIAFFLLLPSLTFGQTSSASVAANQSWPSFWRRINTAINKKDHSSLLKMMPKDFYDGGGGETPEEWLQYIDNNELNGSWRDIRRSFARGAKISRSAEGMPTRVTKDNGYYFEFRKDKKWYFAGVVGD